MWMLSRACLDFQAEQALHQAFRAGGGDAVGLRRLPARAARTGQAHAVRQLRVGLLRSGAQVRAVDGVEDLAQHLRACGRRSGTTLALQQSMSSKPRHVPAMSIALYALSMSL